MSTPRLTAHQQQYLDRLDKDGNGRVDCLLELQNNAERGESCMLRKNLMAAFAICKRIARRRKAARRVLLNRRNR